MRIEKPVRVSRSYLQTIQASPDEVFPLLCPVKEADWVTGWDPRIVYSNSGVAEAGCVFITPGEDEETIWLITKHDWERHIVEFVRMTPGLTVCEIAIHLSPGDPGITNCSVKYAHTALSTDGVKFVEEFDEAYYQNMMQEWENAVNKFLNKN